MVGDAFGFSFVFGISFGVCFSWDLAAMFFLIFSATVIGLPLILKNYCYRFACKKGGGVLFLLKKLKQVKDFYTKKNESVALIF